MAEEEWFLTAELALLKLNESEARKLAREADKMKELFLTMSREDVENLEPATHALEEGNRLRADSPRVFDNVEGLLNAAPEREDGYFLIPRVL